MIFQFWTRKAISACVLFAVFTTASMVVLAGDGRTAAELTVSGKNLNGEAPVVLVNGEPAKSGRSIFSSTSIATLEDTTAVISIGKTGRLEMAPNSSLSIVFDDESVDAELASGRLTLLGSLGTVKVRTNDGKITTLQPGESINASGKAEGRKQSGGGSENWWIWLVVAGGAAVAVLVAVSQSNNDDRVVSPNR